MLKKLIILFLMITVPVFNQTTQELRGVWITNVDSYVLNSDIEIAKSMNYLSSIGVNVVFPVVWNNAYTLYPSQVMNTKFGRVIWPTVAGRDPLEKIVIEAHRVGIEVVPWMEYGFSTSYSQNGGVILQQYPNWGLKNYDGSLTVKNGFDWMSGINPEVQNFMISLSSEILDNYDVDGIQGDDRLPAMPVEGGYDSVTVSIYKNEHNGNIPPQNYYDAGWKRWRADKLNNFYRRFRDSVKVRGDYLLFASAPSNYPWGYDNYLQDSKTWVDSGIVDNFIPQLYRYDLAAYKNELAVTLSYVPQSKRIICFAGVLAKVGTYVIDPVFLLNSVKENRIKGVKGETFFFYEGIANANKINGDSLKASVYKTPALLPYRNGKVFRPQGIIVNEDDDSMVVRAGKWNLIKNQNLGYKPNIYSANDSSYASITYSFDIPYDAWYGVYAYLESNAICSNNVPYYFPDGNDTIVVRVDQSNIRKKSFYKVKDVYLTKGRKQVVSTDTRGIGSNRYINADAMMIMINRKLSPDVIITALDEKNNESFATILSDFVLQQNYPNPFNPETKIKFTVTKPTKVSITVFDLLGREVEDLMDEEKEAGNHEITFNASKLSAGVYIVTMHAGGYTQSKKITLLK